MLSELARISSFTETAGLTLFLVFVRVSAMVGLLPAFGAQTIPARVKLSVAVSFTLIIWPLLLATPIIEVDDLASLASAICIEAAIGLILGLSIRLLVMALQFAGSIAAQSTSIAQIFGAGATPDPMPALGNILTLAGIVLALTMDMHLRIAEAIVMSYDLFPIGILPDSAHLARWGTARVAHAFTLGLTLAAPFVIAALAYNVALGAINRAMPQLMVAFIGAPAITGLGIFLMILSAPVILTVWTAQVNTYLAAPMAMP